MLAPFLPAMSEVAGISFDTSCTSGFDSFVEGTVAGETLVEGALDKGELAISVPSLGEFTCMPTNTATTSEAAIASAARGLKVTE